MGASVIIVQIFMLFLMILAGVIGVKTKILGESSDDVIAKIIFNLTLPCLLLDSITRMETTPELWRNGLGVILFSLFVHGVQMLWGGTSARLLRLPARKREIHIIHTFNGNTVFLGFPLLDALFPGGEILFYAALYNFVSNIVMWTVGVMLLDKSPQSSFFSHLNKLMNANTISLFIGLFLLILGVNIPHVIGGSIERLGEVTGPLAMIFIGIKLSKIRVRAIFSDLSAWIYSFQKLLFIPLILGLLVYAASQVISIPLSLTALMAVLMEASMPGLAMMMVIAKIYEADYETAAKNFFLSTLWSVLTLPMIYLFFNYLFA